MCRRRRRSSQSKHRLWDRVATRLSGAAVRVSKGERPETGEVIQGRGGTFGIADGQQLDRRRDRDGERLTVGGSGGQSQE